MTKRSFDSINTYKSGKIDLKELKEIWSQITLDFRAEPPTDEELSKVF